MSHSESKDAKFETELGAVLNSWDPLPLGKVEGGLPMPWWVTPLLMLLLPGGFLIAGFAAKFAGVPKDSIVQVTLFGGVVVLALIFGSFTVFCQKKHAGKRLAVHERGMRFGTSTVRFDEIETFWMGLDKSFLEKNLPTVSNFQESRKVRRGNDRLTKEAMREDSLSFTLVDGKTIEWRYIRRCYAMTDLGDFVRALSKQAPHILPNQG